MLKGGRGSSVGPDGARSQFAAAPWGAGSPPCAWAHVDEFVLWNAAASTQLLSWGLAGMTGTSRQSRDQRLTAYSFVLLCIYLFIYIQLICSRTIDTRRCQVCRHHGAAVAHGSGRCMSHFQGSTSGWRYGKPRWHPAHSPPCTCSQPNVLLCSRSRLMHSSFWAQRAITRGPDLVKFVCSACRT